MRSGIIFGITVIPALLLAGCGHKGPLRLPVPQAQIPQAHAASPNTPESQPDLPPTQPSKQP